jgi:2-C-methyl-D-erythritol 2,4-cyclodiphosphate synthase
LVRVGFGTDSHRFDPDETKPLVLGGVRLSATGGLLANSDGDVILHALSNALSQAAGGGSLGEYADPLLKQGVTDSSVYLQVPLDQIARQGWQVANVGIMVEAKRPRLSPGQISEVKGSLAALVGIPESAVGLTFTSGEGLTAFGRGEGILAQAVVSLALE